jgi:hypothetical protein
MIRIFAAAAIVVAGAVVSTSAGAASYSATYIFKDVGGASGHHRSQSVKLGDMQACGADRDDVVPNRRLHALLNCMQARGWVVSRIERAAIEPTSIPRAVAEAQDQDDQASADAQAAADEAATADEDQAAESDQQQSDDDSAAATQAMVDQENEAADAEIAADTVAQAQAQSEAASLAADQ